jgi:hypothetical protein
VGGSRKERRYGSGRGRVAAEPRSRAAAEPKSRAVAAEPFTMAIREIERGRERENAERMETRKR